MAPSSTASFRHPRRSRRERRRRDGGVGSVDGGIDDQIAQVVVDHAAGDHGAAVVAVRRAGSIHVFDSINHFFLIGQMIVPGSIYWNMGIGREKGEVEEDAEGVKTMKALGENMAWLIKKLHG